MSRNNYFHFNDALRITDIYQQGSTLHIKASKIWQQRLHNYSAYDSLDFSITEVDPQRFSGTDAELIKLLQILYRNLQQKPQKMMVGDKFFLRYPNGEQTLVDFHELMNQVHRCKDSEEALEILKNLI
ncbi:hypothetical protein [Parashewanella tropica]|uniref:hypothetical protein n=1 Tax=Parashewanella tropica TaxID=2547970 RepID=UPI00105A1683|nr:hypothetical protein [Parashewanella tropica]